MKIAVVGLGYVGLPLSIQFARSCVSVLELDADPKKVELLNNGQSYIKHIQSAEIAELVAAGKFYASTDFGQIKEVEAVIICVPTPLNSTPNSPKCRMRAGIDFHLAFSPEREDPGNQQITLSEARAAAATISTHLSCLAAIASSR